MLRHSKALKGQLNAHEQMNDGRNYLKLEDLTGIFYIFLFGIVLSILTFLLEIVWCNLGALSFNIMFEV